MVIVISMNFCILLHSTDEYDKEEYMEFSRKCCIGCMPDYTYGYYVYFNNMTDIPNLQHNHFILNQITGSYLLIE